MPSGRHATVAVVRAVRAEWVKLWTTPGPGWLLAVTLVVTVGLGAAVVGVTRCGELGCGADVGRLVFSGVYLGQAPVAVLAVLVVSGEFSTALIRTTLAAMPGRGVVLAAKGIVLTGAVGVVGTGAVAGSLMIAAMVLPRHGFTAAAGLRDGLLGGGGLARAAGGTVAYLMLVSLLSLGVAAVVRDSGSAIGGVLGLLFVPPLVAQMVTNERVHRVLEQAAPMSAGLAVQATTGLRQMPIGPWAGLGVLAAWTGAALLTGAVLLWRRDT
ncbi:ABC transporter permease [Dactylosporangium matsuzakiense]|nr:ABC transporter permease [Dactylosporangium matsuzakiense]